MVDAYVVTVARSAVYVLEAFALLWIAKETYTRPYRRIDLKTELFVRDNHAVAVGTVGYLFGVVLALGGALSEPSFDLLADVTAIAVYGLQAILLMLIASWLCSRLLLPHFDNSHEVVHGRNMATAFVEAGTHVANGLVVLAINLGPAPWWQGVLLWAMTQVVLLAVGRLYAATCPFHLQQELQRGNKAVGLAFGGLLVGMGNILSIAVTGEFTDWSTSLRVFGTDVVFGLAVLYAIKRLADVALASGVQLTSEETEPEPNVGAGLLEGFGYLAASMLVVWVFSGA